MKHDRTLIILMALAGAIFCIQFGWPATVIGSTFCAWIIAAALLPARATTIKDHQ